MMAAQGAAATISIADNGFVIAPGVQTKIQTSQAIGALRNARE